jgi:hypothetical protein
LKPKLSWRVHRDDLHRIRNETVMATRTQRRPRTPPARICASCGRRFEWRRAWERNWDDIRYCSDACRRSRPGRFERRIENEIIEALGRRLDRSICPSDVARRIDPNDWRRLMEPVRRAARRLAAAGTVEITQHGKKVDPAAFRGPIRIRFADQAPPDVRSASASRV